MFESKEAPWFWNRITRILDEKEEPCRGGTAGETRGPPTLPSSSCPGSLGSSRGGGAIKCPQGLGNPGSLVVQSSHPVLPSPALARLNQSHVAGTFSDTRVSSSLGLPAPLSLIGSFCTEPGAGRPSPWNCSRHIK